MTILFPIAKRLLLQLSKQYCSLSWKRFEPQLADPRRSQLQTLERILAAARLEQPIKTYAEFRRLPLQSYEQLEERVQASIDGQCHLTQDPPFAYEPTSGSSGRRKLIPYTQRLRRSFSEMFLCWVYDLLAYGPPIEGGRMYFSVSPQFHAPENTQLGLEDDSDYLSGLSSWLFSQFSLVPAQVKTLKDPDDFFMLVAAYLLSSQDLEAISVWSPSFLLAILDFVATHQSELLDALKAGRIERQQRVFSLGKATAAQLRALKQPSLDWPVLLPGLKLISCWGSGNAAIGYRRLQTLFPGVMIQAKGLLATEAPISFPSEKYGLQLPMLSEVFFEFLNDQGQILLLDQIEQGQEYELIISQLGGLLRYRLGDRIKVCSQAQQTPCFEFIGRGQAASDLVGEKLAESFVASQAQSHYPERYLCLIPQLNPAAYLLFADQQIEAQDFESLLLQASHYHNARQLRQLGPLQSQVCPDLAQRLKAYFVNQGMQLGDIKDRYLYPQEHDGRLRDWLLAPKP